MHPAAQVILFLAAVLCTVGVLWAVSKAVYDMPSIHPETAGSPAV